MPERTELTVQARSALTLASDGFWVFPVTQGQKSPPLMDGWKEAATMDPAKVKAMWSAHPSANVGIYTGRYQADKSLIVIDVDCKEGRVGNEELIRLELEGCEFPDTYVQTTPTGGRHLVFCADQAVRQGVSVIGRNLDIRSAGGYIVGAGSQIGGVFYRAHRQAVATTPQWLIDRCAETRITKIDVPENITIDIGAAYEQAKAHLAGAPVARQGEGGDHLTYKTAAQCKDYGLPESLTAALMFEHWNPRCQPPWSDSALREKVAHAYKYGVQAVGAQAPEAAFALLVTSGVPVQPVQPGVSPIEKLNEQYAYAVVNGNQSILFETTDEYGLPKVEWFTPETFHGKLASKTFTDAGGTTSPLTKVWMKSPRRRSYDGVVFAPEQPVDPRFYNLWKGFMCDPAPTGWHPGVQQFLEHAYENICNRDETLYTWLIDYFAHLIQKPWEKPLVALVFRGGKGVGKNALIERVGALLGGHFLLTSNRRYLTGNFNSHLERVLLFALDEAFWSGDHAAEGILKDLITGSKLVIERKGFEPYTLINRVRVMIIGNEKWLVPTSADERRFAVFDVGDKRKQDTKYFTAMRTSLENGGYPYLLTYLKTHPITTDQNIAPASAALQDQKIHSLDIVHQWWHDCLTGGVIPGHHGDTWPEYIGTEELRVAFRYYVRQRNVNSRIPGDSLFTRQLREAAPSLNTSRRTVDGRQIRVFNLAPIDTHRAEWDTFIGQPTVWGAEDAALSVV